MKVGSLKKLVADLPDDAELKVRVGLNPSGTCTVWFIDPETDKMLLGVETTLEKPKGLM